LLASSEGDTERAVVLLGAAKALAGSVDLGRLPLVENVHNQCVFEARRSLGETAFHAAWAAGFAMSVDEAITCGLDGYRDD